jgi:integrase
LRKIFRETKPIPWDILEKEVVDEIIFRTDNPRNRLMLELMARGGMRIGEVLKMTPANIQERKIIIVSPKSGKEAEVVYIPQKVADRLKEYIRAKGIKPDERIFPISYPAARVVVKKAGRLVRINLSPHDLRRHAATFASRSRTPLEIVSKIILRHANLSTTQIYLGKISELEAMRWIDNLYG